MEFGATCTGLIAGGLILCLQPGSRSTELSGKIQRYFMHFPASDSAES